MKIQKLLSTSCAILTPLRASNKRNPSHHSLVGICILALICTVIFSKSTYAEVIKYQSSDHINSSETNIYQQKNYTDYYPSPVTKLVETNASLEKFDSSLGTLTGATLSWNGFIQTVSNSYFWDGNAGSGNDVTSISSVDTFFSSEVSMDLESHNLLFYTYDDRRGCDTSVTYTSGRAYNDCSNSNVDYRNDGQNALDIAVIFGLDNLTKDGVDDFLDINMYAYDGLSMLCRFSSSDSTRDYCGSYVNIVASLTAEITYEYTSAVPVPAAVWLFGSGLLGMIGVARRKKA